MNKPLLTNFFSYNLICTIVLHTHTSFFFKHKSRHDLASALFPCTVAGLKWGFFVGITHLSAAPATASVVLYTRLFRQKAPKRLNRCARRAQPLNGCAESSFAKARSQPFALTGLVEWVYILKECLCCSKNWFQESRPHVLNRKKRMGFSDRPIVSWALILFMFVILCTIVESESVWSGKKWVGR